MQKNAYYLSGPMSRFKNSHKVLDEKNLGHHLVCVFIVKVRKESREIKPVVQSHIVTVLRVPASPSPPIPVPLPHPLHQGVTESTTYTTKKLSSMLFSSHLNEMIPESRGRLFGL